MFYSGLGFRYFHALTSPRVAAKTQQKQEIHRFLTKFRPPLLVSFPHNLHNRAQGLRPANPGKKRAISPMVMLVSELRPDSCVVADVKASPNHSERKNGMM